MIKVVTIEVVDVTIMRAERRNEDLKKEVTDSPQAMILLLFSQQVTVEFCFSLMVS